MPEFAWGVIFGASLLAFQKSKGTDRPIAVGSVYHKLTGRVGARQDFPYFLKNSARKKSGVGVEQGSEAAVHALRAYVLCNMMNPKCNKSVVKVNINKAFNSAREDVVLKQPLVKCSEMFPMLMQVYSA